MNEQIFLQLVEESQKRKQEGESYADILRLLISRGLDVNQCREIFSSAFNVPFEAIKALRFWREDNSGRINDDMLNEQIHKAVTWVDNDLKLP